MCMEKNTFSNDDNRNNLIIRFPIYVLGFLRFKMVCYNKKQERIELNI